MPRAITGRSVPKAGLAASLLWPPALVSLLTIAVGRIGFNPTDEGLVLSYAGRILQGQVPHRDFISPRPVGSSLLHMIDLVMPGPLLLTSRVIDLCEMTAIAILFGVLVFRSTPARWSPVQTALVIGALVIGLHTFPLMAWYTVDGLLLTLAGFVLLLPAAGSPPGRRRRWIGLLLAGAALTTKQSFFLAPVLAAFVASWPAFRAGRPVFSRRLLASATVSAVPAVLYVGVLVLLGAGGAMRTQLLGGRGVDLLAPFSPDAGSRLLVLVAVAGWVGFALWSLRRRRPQWEPAAHRAVAVAALLACAVILGFGALVFAGDWGNELVQLLVVVIAVEWVATRRPDGVAVLIAAVAWMTTLSWGDPTADLAAGGVALVLVWRAVTTLVRTNVDVTAPWRIAQLAGALALVVVTVGASVQVRTQDVYREPPAAALTVYSSSDIPALSGIAIDPTTQRYLTDVTRCIHLYPARSIAILPDNPVLYLALGIHNPFPIDWMAPTNDYRGSEQRIVDAARALDARGNYLVLFETFDASRLQDVGPGLYDRLVDAAAAHPGEPLPYAPGVLQPVRDSLHGRLFGCGPFIADYAP